MMIWDNDDIDDNQDKPSALTRPPPSCFGYGSKQEGTWSAQGTWTPKKKGQCDLDEYWDFFEDKDTVTAVVRCWERRRWIVSVGDSNSREMFSAINGELQISMHACVLWITSWIMTCILFDLALRLVLPAQMSEMASSMIWATSSGEKGADTTNGPRASRRRQFGRTVWPMMML